MFHILRHTALLWKMIRPKNPLSCKCSFMLHILKHSTLLWKMIRPKNMKIKEKRKMIFVLSRSTMKDGKTPLPFTIPTQPDWALQAKNLLAFRVLFCLVVLSEPLVLIVLAFEVFTSNSSFSHCYKRIGDKKLEEKNCPFAIFFSPTIFFPFSFLSSIFLHLVC